MKAITQNFQAVMNEPSIADPYDMVSVFKTDVSNKTDADAILKSLKRQFPGGKFNFDLEDTDRVLRIEYKRDIIHDVVLLFKGRQFICELLI